MPASPGPGPLPAAAGPGEAARADDTIPRIGPAGHQPGEFPHPLTLQDQQSFEAGIPNIARVYDALLGGCFL
jgi:hypothetical protein